MSRIFTSIDQLIGSTPLLEPVRIAREEVLRGRLLLKLEQFNPAGSVKDRVAAAMLAAAEDLGTKPVIIEPTSGNTGIALAALAAARNWRCIIVMPDSMSRERRALMGAYGAEVILTPGAQGMQGALAKAEELARQIPGSFVPGQFRNPANPDVHYRTTGPEIWADTDGEVDIFIAGVGTGGTITGVGRFLKERKPNVQILAVEPAASPLLSQGWSGIHGIQGIGANFVPEVLDRSVLDGVLTVTDAQAIAAARRMGREEGVLIGISAGAVLAAAIHAAKLDENAGKTLVALLADSGERYLSTGVLSKE